MKMGMKVVVVMVIVLVMVLVDEGSMGLEMCNMKEDGLLACKPSVTKPKPIEPSSDCCTAISGADLTCLCSYRNSFMLPSLGIDPDLALALPAKCNLTTPSTC